MAHMGILIALPVLLMFVFMGIASNGFERDLPGRIIYNTIVGMIVVIPIHAIGVVGLVHLLRGMPDPKAKEKSSKSRGKTSKAEKKTSESKA